MLDVILEQCDKEVFDSINELADIWSVYIVECSDGALYCGISNNVDKRVEAHSSGKGAKYTKTRTPVRLVYCEEVGTMSDAMKRERQIKKMSRKKKLALVAAVADPGYATDS